MGSCSSSRPLTATVDVIEQAQMASLTGYKIPASGGVLGTAGKGKVGAFSSAKSSSRKLYVGIGAVAALFVIWTISGRTGMGLSQSGQSNMPDIHESVKSLWELSAKDIDGNMLELSKFKGQ